MSEESSKIEREISSNDQENESSSKNRPARKVRSALRRALSDRVLKIIDFSQQHIDLEKMMKKRKNRMTQHFLRSMVSL
jgi:hypothetical protein